ncbi:MAG: DUF1624 domain-containing protein [Clostridia bacterium]|nr:DUF1624 domain-containing protein [Clostridia bacterium]
MHKTAAPERFGLIDTLRGLCVWGMVVYHTLFDILAVFGGENAQMPQVLDAVRTFGAAAFIFLSGVCLHFETRPLRRFLMLFGGGLAVSAVTFLVMPEAGVLFGILTFMAVSGGIGALMKRLLQKLPAAPFAAASLILFLLLLNVNFGYFGTATHILYFYPEWLHKNLFTAFLGFPYPGFQSGDYFPLLPWIFAYFAGFFFYAAVGPRPGVQGLLQKQWRPLSVCGRYSFYIYLIHQPVIYGCVALLQALFK